MPIPSQTEEKGMLCRLYPATKANEVNYCSYITRSDKEMRGKWQCIIQEVTNEIMHAF